MISNPTRAEAQTTILQLTIGIKEKKGSFPVMMLSCTTLLPPSSVFSFGFESTSFSPADGRWTFVRGALFYISQMSEVVPSPVFFSPRLFVTSQSTTRDRFHLGGKVPYPNMYQVHLHNADAGLSSKAIECRDTSPVVILSGL